MFDLHLFNEKRRNETKFSIYVHEYIQIIHSRNIKLMTVTHFFELLSTLIEYQYQMLHQFQFDIFNSFIF